MILGIKRIVAALGLCGLSVQLSTAAPITGDLDLEIVGAPVYDLSGPWTFDHNLNGAGGQPTPLSFGIPLDITSRGKLFADGVTSVLIGNEYVAATFRARGSSTGGGSRPTRLTLTVSMSGEDTISGVLTRFRVTTSYALDVSADGKTVFGKASGTASLGKLGKASFRLSNFSMPIPRDTGGEWNAHLSLLALNKVVGSGYIQFPAASGIYLPGEIKGSYSSKWDQTTLNFKGVREGAGNKVRVRATPENLISLDGVILGQRVKE